jgi:hypothetical protein
VENKKIELPEETTCSRYTKVYLITDVSKILEKNGLNRPAVTWQTWYEK